MTYATSSGLNGFTIVSRRVNECPSVKTDRRLDKEFALQDEEDDQDTPPREVATSSSTAEPERRRSIEEERSNIPLEMQEWFGQTDEAADQNAGEEADSETELESDYDEARVEDDDVALDEIRSGVFSGDAEDSQMEDAGPEEATMGESKDAMEYDQEKIFRHLCFYLDTPQNAQRNGMVSKSKHAPQIETSFVDIEDIIAKNGGRIVELGDPKLTHIVVDKRDSSRRKDLMKKTSAPKHRRLVISEFIRACIDEDTLLDEEEFAP